MAETARLTPDRAGIERAAALLSAGALVAFPTETVYGLGADAANAEAVARIFEAKGRPDFNPLIVHLAEAAMVERHACMTSPARCLAEAFWPGALTLVLPRRPDCGLADAVTAGLPTLALRVPAHPVAQALLRAFAGPVAAPSANRSGRISATSAAHVLDGLGGRIAAVLDDGPCPLGLESTVLGVDEAGVRLLRPGAITEEAVEAVLGAPLLRPEATEVSAPGQLCSHYAPGARLRLNAAQPRPGEAWLGFGPIPAGVTGPALTLSRDGDLDEAAANLFAHLRALDSAIGGRGIIAVAPIPEEGLGRAINDRLTRAAAPRR